jgi:hypothetical protein
MIRFFLPILLFISNLHCAKSQIHTSDPEKQNPDSSQKPSQPKPLNQPMPEVPLTFPCKIATLPFHTPQSLPGEIRFDQIPSLQNNWWNHTDTINPVGWDPNTYYLWGANSSNYQITDPTKLLSGGGMASSQGPTKGHGHPRYVGVVTTDNTTHNQTVFLALQKRIEEGKTIQIPTYGDTYSLGAGLAHQWFSTPQGWYCNQFQVLSPLLQLLQEAKTVEFPNSSLQWVDKSRKSFPLQSIEDVKKILKYLREQLST